MCAWQTHDRDTDHHGTQDDTTVTISADLPYAYGDDGDTLHAVLAAISDSLGSAVPRIGLLPQFASAPHVGTETEGESYYDTTIHKGRTWNGSEWKDWWS